ncbi:hypothetical protein [Tenacibaculum larymnensis]|uniref:Uncharacterized protein n=1 Tax=Tenacibaculum larymnensis TaxID=2878201 RepID=A0A9X4EK23_9FLAO|nr:hypothetical protein [Tenacibaculum larymnensis]MDE1205412.1 hypothetical protein [Tenacibaculum larymnensis]
MKQNKETLKQFFETGDKPTQQQYADLIDSYIDAKQPEGEANRRFVIDELGEVSVASEQQVPEYTLSPISGTNTVDLLKDGISVSQIDLTPYLDNTNLARLVSGTVDANGLATFTRDDNSTFTVDLSNLKDTQIQADFNQTDPTKLDYIKNNPRYFLNVLIEEVESYSVTTYEKQTNDLDGLDFSFKKIYAVLMPTATYVFFSKDIGSTEGILDIANNSDLCMMYTNGRALLQRTDDFSIQNFNSFKFLNKGGSQIFSSEGTRTVKMALNSVKGVNELAILDNNGVEQFKTKELQFDENFVYNSAEKEVQIKNNSKKTYTPILKADTTEISVPTYKGVYFESLGIVHVIIELQDFEYITNDGKGYNISLPVPTTLNTELISQNVIYFKGGSGANSINYSSGTEIGVSIDKVNSTIKFITQLKEDSNPITSSSIRFDPSGTDPTNIKVLLSYSVY